MKTKSVPAVSVGACLVLAAIAVSALTLSGEWRAGLALGAGLVIGSVNGLAASRALDAPLGFQATSIFRLAVMTVAAIGVALLIGLQLAWLVLIGVAGAQLVLVAVAARSLLKR